MFVRRGFDENPCSKNIRERFSTVLEVGGAGQQGAGNYTEKERNRCAQIKRVRNLSDPCLVLYIQADEKDKAAVAKNPEKKQPKLA